jgi:phage-related minor tail protein
VFEAIRSFISEKVSAALSTVSSVFSSIKEAISSRVSAAKEAVSNAFNTIKTSITEKVNSAKATVSNVFSNIKETISNALNSAKSTVTNIFTSIKTSISDKINSAKDTVKSAIDKIKSFFNFSWSLPHLKLPHISISGSFSLTPPSVPHFGISWYAKGGVFDTTTLFPFRSGNIGGLGEDGAEAIVPLEKNTEWLTRIADMLNDRMGGKQIVLMVNDKVFAETAITSINNLTKQTGSLGLVLA